MASESEVRLAYERKFGEGSWDVVPSTLQAGFMYVYAMGVAEAFEAAAKLVDKGTGCDDWWCTKYAAAIREMAKEMK